MKIQSSVELFARPLDSGCFQVWFVEADRLTNSLWLVYQRGGKCEAKAYVKDHPALLRAFAENPFIRKWLIELYGVDVDFVPTSPYFSSRVIYLLSYLKSEYPTHSQTFAYLRGSEVSLDSLVQLWDSPPTSPKV